MVDTELEVYHIERLRLMLLKVLRLNHYIKRLRLMLLMGLQIYSLSTSRKKSGSKSHFGFGRIGSGSETTLILYRNRDGLGTFGLRPKLGSRQNLKNQGCSWRA